MAAGRDMTASITLRLQDRVSAGLSRLTRRLNGLAAVGRRIGLIGGALAGLSLMGPLQQAAAFEDTLRQNAITASRSGAAVEEMIARTGVAYERLALASGQRSRDISAAAGTLVAANLPQDLIDQFLPVLARTATATGASLQELSSTAIALSQNLGIRTAGEMANALGALATAGKEGRFELRDMAREFPLLTASAEALGLRGREGVNSLAAMLQVARQGSATASEAATNLQNFLSKITSPETVKNFREMGVNIEGVLADAARRGINPIEAVVQKVRQLTQGNMFKVGELFGDMQVLNFLRPMLRGTAEYLRILELARNANAEILDTDFESRSRGILIQLEIMQERAEQIGRRLMLGMAGGLGPLNTALAGVQAGIEWLDGHYPGLLDQTLAWGGSLVVVAGVLGLLAKVLPIIITGLRFILVPLGWLAKGFAALRLILVGLGLTATAAGSLIAVAVAAIAVAAFLIWRNWSAISTFFSNLWTGIRAGFDTFSNWIVSWAGGPLSRAAEAFRAAWAGLTDWFRGVFRTINSEFETMLDRIQARLPEAAAQRAGAGRLFREQSEAAGPATPEQRRSRFGGRASGFYPPEAAAPARGRELRGRIEVVLPPGARLGEVAAERGLTIAPAERGMILGRP